MEFARHVCGIEGATSTEIDENAANRVIDFIPDQRNVTEKGGTMRLGAYPCVLEEHSLAAKAYGKRKITERHRHRYEVNNDYRDILTKHGLILSGLSPDGGLIEMIELPEHPWFIACQFHPEFKSRPYDCHPLFRGFIQAALIRKTSAGNMPLLEAAKR